MNNIYKINLVICLSISTVTAFAGTTSNNNAITCYQDDVANQSGVDGSDGQFTCWSKGTDNYTKAVQGQNTQPNTVLCQDTEGHSFPPLTVTVSCASDEINIEDVVPGNSGYNPPAPLYHSFNAENASFNSDGNQSFYVENVTCNYNTFTTSPTSIYIDTNCHGGPEGQTFTGAVYFPPPKTFTESTG